MRWQLRVQRPPIRNISDLSDRCLNIWYNLSPVIYQRLVASMPRRVEVVLRAKGLFYDAVIENTYKINVLPYQPIIPKQPMTKKSKVNEIVA
ncbi:transposase domain containing protein [Nephila pilipes]|uniref:Transposase domain containing protein n=1 Tax=Nephila pilipes TaxID=299642 RepID=A0A8X6TYD4_NEPPI|nr:transposase domain containing protein [Nephila pilipes]